MKRKGLWLTLLIFTVVFIIRSLFMFMVSKPQEMFTRDRSTYPMGLDLKITRDLESCQTNYPWMFPHASNLSERVLDLWRGGPEQGLQIRLVHSRKAGGTSLRRMIADASSLKGIQRSALHVNEHYVMDISELDEDHAQRNRTIFLTSLREPISRINSSFFFEGKWPIYPRQIPREKLVEANDPHVDDPEKVTKTYENGRSWDEYIASMLQDSASYATLKMATAVPDLSHLEPVKMVNSRMEISSRYCNGGADFEMGTSVHNACCDKLRTLRSTFPGRLRGASNVDESRQVEYDFRVAKMWVKLDNYFVHKFSGYSYEEDRLKCPASQDDLQLAKCVLAAMDLVMVIEWESQGSDMARYVAHHLDNPSFTHWAVRPFRRKATVPPWTRKIDQMPIRLLTFLEDINKQDMELFLFSQHLVRHRAAQVLRDGDESKLVGMDLINPNGVFRDQLIAQLEGR